MSPIRRLSTGPLDPRTEEVRRTYDELAERYDRWVASPERLLLGDGRRWVCTQAAGDVLEVACGTGRNLPFYSSDVRLIGIDISDGMLRIARQRARELGRAADLRCGDAQAMELPDESFDAVVCTFGLCSIPDDGRALAEMHRVLRPAGRLLLLEHVRSPVRWVRALLKLLDPICQRSGDHLLRDPMDHLLVMGFEVNRLERSKWGLLERVAASKLAPGSSRSSDEVKR